MERHSVDKRKRLEEFERLCHQQGLPLTVQRRVILEALFDREDHPTADQIFDDIKTRIPGVSRTTVYRVLETLVRVGVARKACHFGATARFDPNTERHHHLVCLHCDKVVDLDDSALNALPLPDVRRAGFEITDYSIHFRGTCSDCQRKMAKPHPSRPGL